MRSRLLGLLALAAALPIAGCGDSGPGDLGADPAKAIPASAPIYVELVVRPEGDLRDGAQDALGKLLRTDDPGGAVAGLFDRLAKGETSWEELKGWLGPRIGVYFTDFRNGAPVGALVADQTDEGKAREALVRLADGQEDLETAVIGDYAVIGTPDGVEAVRRTLDGGDALSEVPDYGAARAAVAADEALGVVYVEPQGILDALTGALEGLEGSPFQDPASLGVFRDIFAKAGRAAAVSFHVRGDALRIQAAGIGVPAGAVSTAAADGLAALPADAWLAIGFGDLGQAIGRGLDQLSDLAKLTGQTGPDFEGLLEQFRQKTGVDVRQDLLSWMGDGAIYARGTSLTSVGAVLTVRTKDPERSRKAVGVIAQGLQGVGAQVRPAQVQGYDVAVELRSPQAPISLFIAANDERVSVGVNPQALTDVLDPESRLGDSATYEGAAEDLGEGLRPIAIVDTQTIIGLLESFGIAEQEGYAKVKPYLDVLGPISVGSARDGDVQRFSLAVGLR